MRLIDADALKAKLKIDTNTATYSDYCNGYCDARHVDLDAIDAAPTIEPEVRHGRWITKDSNTAKCSCCGWWQRTTMYYLPDDIAAFSKCYRFCTACGADMREGGAGNRMR